jgi:DNA mismatch repair protein MutL
VPLNASAPSTASVIGILDELTINRIAAGEVVDRPASAVKELVENAIDAGARRIRVRLEGGGLDLVSVEDDGSGMTLHDLRLCWMRHATSKLVKLEDLMHVGTYGFRGEALSSLASVAELRIDTRHHLEEDGHAIVVRDGQLRSEAPSGWVRGTRIEVRGLFAGIPVRRKFMGSAASEAQRVLTTMVRQALARPDVEFRLHHGARELLVAPAENRKARVRRLLGQLAEGLCEVLWEHDGVAITGFVGGPGTDRGRADQIHVSINRRPISGGMLQRAVAKGLNLPAGRYPVAVLDVTLPLETVDVNVHPQKKEVRFQSEAPIFQAVSDAVANALDLGGLLPLYAPVSERESSVRSVPFAAGSQAYEIGLSASETSIAFPGSLASLLGETLAQEQDVVQEDLFSASERLVVFPGMEPRVAKPAPGPISLGGVPFLGTEGYLLCQIQGGLMVIDQRAAHERILYEQALRSLSRDGAVPSQQLLFPRTLELPLREHQTAMATLGQLRDLSFDLEPFGGNVLLLRGIPASVSQDRAEAILHEILAQLAEEELTSLALNEEFARAYAQAAAVRRDQDLPSEERTRLVDELFATSDPWTSPGGRPIVARLSGEDLSRLFR